MNVIKTQSDILNSQVVFREEKIIFLGQAVVNEVFYFQYLSLNVHSWLDLFLYGCSSLFEKNWQYQRYHNLLDQTY